MFMVTVDWGGTAALLTLCFSDPALLFATISANKPAPSQGQGGRVNFPARAAKNGDCVEHGLSRLGHIFAVTLVQSATLSFCHLLLGAAEITWRHDQIDALAGIDVLDAEGLKPPHESSKLGVVATLSVAHGLIAQSHLFDVSSPDRYIHEIAAPLHSDQCGNRLPGKFPRAVLFGCKSLVCASEAAIVAGGASGGHLSSPAQQTMQEDYLKDAVVFFCERS